MVYGVLSYKQQQRVVLQTTTVAGLWQEMGCIAHQGSCSCVQHRCVQHTIQHMITHMIHLHMHALITHLHMHALTTHNPALQPFTHYAIVLLHILLVHTFLCDMVQPCLCVISCNHVCV